MQKNDSRGRSRGRITTVKSGCITCKARKVKCDESFPACRRCVSSGRTCAGYGIWGGGGSQAHCPQQLPLPETGTIPAVDLYLSPFIPQLVTGKVEKALLEWYRCRTAKKIPGAFFSDFWTILLPQASVSEPAVLHAVLALSASHWDGTMQYGIDKEKVKGHAPKKMERFTLEHYNHAIQHLRKPPTSQSLVSRQTALITCLVFITIDLLRGHFATAQFHLRSGLKLLGDEHLQTEPQREEGVDSVDYWIAEVFLRMRLQLELFGQRYDYPYMALRSAHLFPITPKFASYKEAWSGLQALTNAIFTLRQQARERELKSLFGDPERDGELAGHQQRLCTGLARWNSIYEASHGVLVNQEARETLIMYRVLHAHQIMTCIMADTCLRLDDEMIYDSHTDRFLAIINFVKDMWPLASAQKRPLWSPPGRLSDMNSTIVDMGVVPPLYYVAVKCRVHRIRLHALRFMEDAFHREGIWDSEIISRISKRIIEMEEVNYYKNLNLIHDFGLQDDCTPQELDWPVLPESNRIKGLQVELCGSPLKQVVLHRQGDGEDKICIGVFDILSQTWTN